VSAGKIAPGPHNYIDGAWRGPGKGGGGFENRNPATGELLGVFPESTAADADAAVAAARAAFPAWSRTPAVQRGRLLLKAMRLIERQKEDFAVAMTKEMGKPLAEARGDVQEAADTAHYFSGEGQRLFGQTTTSESPDKFAMSLRAPVGVCAMITPWNFPMAIPSWKIFPALLCGDTVVLKPASLTPQSAWHFARALEEAGVPPGVVNLVFGDGPTVGQRLVEHPGVDLVSFTGSSAVGAKVAEACGRLFKKCSLECGGKNAQIVMEDADLELALEGALWGAFGTTGQRCTATSRLIVHEKVYKAFTSKFAAQARALKVGNGLNPKTQVGPLVSAAQKENVRRWVQAGLKKDKARLLVGGKALEQGEHAGGHFFEPTVFEGTPEMSIAREEIFGPVATVMKVKTFEEAVDVLNGTDYGLSGSIYTRDVNRVMRAVRDMKTGIAYVNAPTIGAEVHLPFGGVKRTGNGHREAGPQALDVFSEWKAVYIDYSGKLQRAQIDT
jgi:alpha-ketoglutaric semialdehyde dehydrogenase